MLQEDRKRSGPLFVVIPSLNISVCDDGCVRLTRKFVEGMRLTAQLWPGRIAAAMFSETAGSSGNLDEETYAVATLPFELRIIGDNRHDILSVLHDADVVQLGGDHRLRSLPAFLNKKTIPFVFVSEYSLKTRVQIIFAEVANPILRIRRTIWEWRQEIHNRRAVRSASGVQCNGTPTFDVYSKLNSNTMLYFDSRISEEMIPETPAVASRAGRFEGAEPIRLAFSGRLNRMKGADDLVEVARILQKANLPFILDIFGDGPVATEMHDRIRLYGLQNKVRMKGVVDFTSELVPYVRDKVDLFVCCHRQGDPSCTYIETLACGVPIAGYENEALLGIVNRAPVGWVTPMNDPGLLARKVIELYTSPKELAQAATNAIGFARMHAFVYEFKARTGQLVGLLPDKSMR